MADAKISQLTPANVPLAGTETLPIVQSGTTKKVAVSDLTAGRAISAGAITSTGKFYEYLASDGSNIPTWFQWANSGVLGILSGGDSAYADVYTKFQGGLYNSASTNNIDLIVQSKDPGKDAGWRVTSGSGSNAGADNGYLAISKIKTNGTAIVATEAGRWTTDGNYVPVAAKGVNFTANTPATGMTSQLLNWYEEGAWTPTQGGGLTVIGAFSSAGTYTRIGRQVTVAGYVAGATGLSAAGGGAIVAGGLPFAPAGAPTGSACGSVATDGSPAIIVSGSIYITKTMTSVVGNTIYFTVTYQV